MQNTAIVYVAALIVLQGGMWPADLPAAEIAIVGPATWDSFVPDGELTAKTTYELSDGANYLHVETKLTNLSSEAIDYAAIDEIRADGTVFVKRNSGDLAWAYDRWWNAAYGTVASITGALPDGDPEVQVARLALWDDRSEKLIQQNHPDLGWLLFGKNGDANLPKPI